MNPSIVSPNRRILIIDDNPAIHEDFRKVLGGPDAAALALEAAEPKMFDARPLVTFEVDAASQGQEALQMVKQALAAGRPYAMAFVDMRMPPGWDGVETIRHLWQVCPDLQIVICTAFSDDSLDDVLEKLDPKDRLLILKKPFENIEATQLANALTEKWRTQKVSNLKLADLELAVRHRTRDLEQSRMAALNMIEDSVRSREKTEQALVKVQHEMAERERTEAKLRDSEASLHLFRTLIERSDESIYVIDPGTQCFLDANESACQRLGYTRTEFLALKLRDLTSGSNPADIEISDLRLQSETPLVFETLHRRKDGTSYPVEVRLSPVTLDRKYVVIFAHDITARKAAESMLREQNEIITNAHEGVMIVNLANEIALWNRGAEQIFGWTAAEALARRPEVLLGVDKLENFLAARAAVERDGFWNGELQMQARDGRRLVVDCRITLVRDEAGRPRAQLNFLADITEKKLLEEKFLRTQRLESIGTLSSGIAHDLNNILAPVLMASGLLRGELKSPRGREMIAIMESSAQRGARIIQQLLTFSRGVDGERVDVQLRHLIREMVDIAQETFPRNIKVVYNIASDLRPVSADPTQLHQVLMNLCINARDAMPDGGTLTLKGENMELDAIQRRAHPEVQEVAFALITVTDTGHGIPANIIDRIFDPFFTTKGIGKGTGLGLPTVLGIVKSHGGFIEVQSTPGAGTSFQVFLPVKGTGPTSAVADATAVPEQGRGELVLVVDDEEAIWRMAAAILEQWNYRVISASDGQAGLALFRERRGEVRLVVVDLMMPVMGGLALIRALRALEPKLRIIAVTGLQQEADSVELRQLGVNEILMKPYAPPRLLAAVATELAK